jgi:preprotein translocase subunit SecA
MSTRPTLVDEARTPLIISGGQGRATRSESSARRLDA